MTRDDKGRRKSAADIRKERLEAALKANLKKRKEQARARARGTAQSKVASGDDAKET